MSTCDCPKQDQYANCCYRKIAETKLDRVTRALEKAKEEIMKNCHYQDRHTECLPMIVLKEIEAIERGEK